MKNKIFLTFVVASIFISSCHERFLSEEVYTFLSPSNFYNTAKDATIAVNACYDALQQRELYQQNMYLFGDFASDIADANGGYNPFHIFTVNAESSQLFNTWSKSYQGINRCNAVIERVPAIEMDEILKNRLIGEAKFLRALHHFNLIRIFGNIPIGDKETTGTDDIEPTNVGTSDAVWRLIIDDLKFAELNLPTSYSGDDIGRATKGAAKGMLAKVHLTRAGWGVANEWALAAQKCEEVIGMGYQLYVDFSKNFDIYSENGVESLFQVQFVVDNQEGMARLEKDFGVRSAPEPYKGDSYATGTPEFYNKWSKADKRFYATWIDSYTVSGKTEKYPGNIMRYPHTRKYKIRAEEIDRLSRFSINVNVLRYADVLLMHSEALNMVSGPSVKSVDGLNQVRVRAGLDPIDPTKVNKEQLRQIIINERAMELCFEFHAFFDYQRQNVLAEKMASLGITVEPHRKFFPIPQKDIDINPNLKQNEGY